MAVSDLRMKCVRYFTSSLLACASLTTVGCQSNMNMSSTALPGPNFAGPVVNQARVIKPAEVVKVEYPKPQPQQQPKIGNIPSAWVPLASAVPRKWNWIVVHHSATAEGGAARFQKAHQEKGWDELGYHFVIGNGTDTGDGVVEVGGRWPVQKHGAHAKTPDNQYNEHGIGICLVGNFDITRPTAKQMASLTKLVAFLADKYNVRQADIIGHQMTGKQTDCPGKNMDIAALRNSVARQRTSLVEDKSMIDPASELMQSASR